MYNKIITLVCLLLCCTLLQACSGTVALLPSGAYHYPRPDTFGFEESIDSWHGAPIEELIASWGEPTQILSLATTRKLYIREAKVVNDSGIVYEVTCKTDIWVTDGLIDKRYSDFSKGGIYKNSLLHRVLGGGNEKNRKTQDCGSIDAWPPRHRPDLPMRDEIWKY